MISKARDHKYNVGIYYGGFIGKAGGAFMHAKLIAEESISRGLSVKIITLDSLPFYCRYLPHLVEKIINFVNYPMGYLYKGLLTKILFKTCFKYHFDLTVYEDIYIAQSNNVPTVVILHAIWTDNLQSRRASALNYAKLKKAEVRLLNGIEAPILTVSEPYLRYLKNEHFANFHLPEIAVAEMGISLPNHLFLADIQRKEKSIIYVGSLEKRKNILMLLQVYEILKRSNAKYSLTIVGDGPDLNELRNYCCVADLSVEFRGRLNNDEVLNLLICHDIYLHTSLKESFSFSILEAKLCGLKTVAYEKLEIPNCFIDCPVSSFDPVVWADAIQKIEKFSNHSFDWQFYSREAMFNRMLNAACAEKVFH